MKIFKFIFAFLVVMKTVGMNEVPCNVKDLWALPSPGTFRDAMCIDIQHQEKILATVKTKKEAEAQFKIISDSYPKTQYIRYEIREKK